MTHTSCVVRHCVYQDCSKAGVSGDWLQRKRRSDTAYLRSNPRPPSVTRRPVQSLTAWQKETRVKRRLGKIKIERHEVPLQAFWITTGPDTLWTQWSHSCFPLMTSDLVQYLQAAAGGRPSSVLVCQTFSFSHSANSHSTCFLDIHLHVFVCQLLCFINLCLCHRK